VINIAIEGMMLAGAMTGSLVASVTDNLWIGLLAAVLAGVLMGLIHAVLSIKYKINQIISGTVINIFATGITSYISAKFLQTYQDLNNPGTFRPFEIPLLSKIPVIGPILFDNNIFVYAMYIFLIVIHVGLFYTRWGLRHRSVGEHPKAADTLGINVIRTRYIAVILGSMMAGFAGGYFTLGWPLRRSHDCRARFYRFSRDDLRKLDAFWFLWRRPAVRLRGLAGLQAGDPQGGHPLRVPAHAALYRHDGGIGRRCRPRANAGCGWRTLRKRIRAY
jgi:hypothetical protein